MEGILLIWTILLTIAFAVLRRDVNALRDERHDHVYWRQLVRTNEKGIFLLREKYESLEQDRQELKGRFIVLEEHFLTLQKGVADHIALSKAADKSDKSAYPKVPLALYVWEDVLCDHTSGVAFALAADIDHARQLIADSSNTPERIREEISKEPTAVHSHTPIGYAIWGGA